MIGQVLTTLAGKEGPAQLPLRFTLQITMWVRFTVLSHLALEWAVTEQLGRAAERTKGLMLPRVLSRQTERGLGQFSVPQRQGRKLCV